MSNDDKDLVLTPVGMPKLQVGETEYPVFFPVSAVKAYAERKGVSFQQMVGEGWKATDLDEDDMRFLLLEGLRGAERRRQVFQPGPARVIDDALVDTIFDLYHISQIWQVILEAWNHGPSEAPPDPR